MLADVYRFCGGRVIALDGETALVCDARTGDLLTLSRDAAVGAARCRTFRTLAEHARDLHTWLPRGPRAGTWETALEEARRAGALTSAECLREAFLAGAAPAATPPVIRTIGIPTRNRPRLLHRLLRDLADHLDVHGRRARVMVVDDSDSPTMRQATREAAASMADADHLSVHLVDRDARLALAGELSDAADVSPAVTRFGLLGDDGGPLRGAPVTVGACRNTLLLLGAGEPLLFLDDDVRCRVAPVPGARDEILFSEDAFTGRFFETAEQIEAVEFRDDDLLAIHETGLGTSVHHLASAFAAGRPDEWSAVAPDRVASGHSGPIAVRVSCLGLIGDAALDDPLHYYLHGRETLARLAASEGLYRAALVNRLLLRGPRGRLVRPSFDAMSYCMAVDHSALLPPFMPVMRAEESVFSSLVSRLPGSLFAVSPMAILHQPEDGRRFATGAAEARAGRFTLNDIVSLVVRAEAIRGASPADRLRSVGVRLAELAAMPVRDLEAHVGDVLIPVLASYIRRLHEALPGPEPQGGASLWDADVRRLMAACRRRLQTREFVLPLDVANHWGPERAWSRTQRALASFASLLEAWPRLVEAAARIAARPDRSWTSFDTIAPKDAAS